MRPRLKVALAAGLLVAGCSTGGAPLTSDTAPQVREAHSRTLAGATYASALEDATRQVETLKRLHGRDGGWLTLANVGKAQLSRARLTGSFVDYAEAGRTLDAAQALAPAGSGPSLVRADYALAVHDPAAAAVLLASFDARPLRTRAQAGMAQQLRWEIALSELEPDAAIELLEAQAAQAQTQDGTSYARWARLGLAYRAAQRWEESLRAFEMARTLAQPGAAQRRAWVELHLGLTHLDRGDLEAASQAYALADAELPGWWLVLEHQAEVAALQGHTQRARELYERVIQQSERGEFVRALSELVDEPDARARLVAKADRLAAASERILPTAARAHGHGAPPSSVSN